jgi:Lsr2
VARKVQVHLLDDIDGSVADETVKFSLDSSIYEIDLSTTHAESLRKELAKYIVAGRREPRGLAAGQVRRSPSPKPAATANPNQNQAIREWAKQTGLELSNRGRIPATVLAQFEAAHA